VKLVCRGSIAEAVGAEARSGIIQIGRGGVNTFFKKTSPLRSEAQLDSLTTPCNWTSKCRVRPGAQLAR
jgi:hypothetical protein